MNTTRLIVEHVIGFPKQAKAGMSIKDFCRSGGLSQPTFSSDARALAAWKPRQLSPLAERDALTQTPGQHIVDIAHLRRWFGYQLIHDLLHPVFPCVNLKRVYRLYKDSNLAVRRRKKATCPPWERAPLQLAQRVNDVWSMDFVSDSLSNGWRIECLTVADHFSHECVDIAVDYAISGQYVTCLLDQEAPFIPNGHENGNG